MVRIIDSDAINKRVFADIANTFQHSQQITGENTVQDFEIFLKRLKPQTGSNDANAAAMDNFNFNGIEFSKIKQLINYIQTHKKHFAFDRKLVEVSNNKEKSTQFFTFEDGDNPAHIQLESSAGIVLNGFETKFEVPMEFDGRNSFVYPRFVFVYMDFGASACDISVNDNETISGGYITAAENLKKLFSEKYKYYKPTIEKSAKLGLTERSVVFDRGEFIKCWSASSDKSDGNNCMIVDKTRDVIKITSSADLSFKNFGFDRSGSHRTGWNNSYYILNDNWIARVYLDVFFMYWRDK